MSLPDLVQRRKLPVRVAFVTHALSPHRLALLECVADSVADLRVFLSQAEDKLHKFPLETGRLNVTVQRSLNWEHKFQNVHGYPDVSHVHIPYDTYGQLLRYRPDVVVTTELGMRSLLAAVYRSRHSGTRLVLWATLSERTEATRGRVRGLVRRWLVGKVDSVFVNGKGGAAYMRTLGYKGALYMVPYAIDDAPFQTMSYLPVPGRFRLLYTGQLIPRKGLPAFCRTLNAWCNDHPETKVELTLVGEGDEHDAIQAIPTVGSLTVKVFDRVNQEQLVRYHEEADIFAFPTLGDEWGVVVNEALIAGRPVLGSVHSQAATELVEEGVNGWLWNPDQDGSLYAALTRAFSSSADKLKKMSEMAKQTVLRISPSVVADTVLQGLQDVSDKRSRQE